MKVTLLIPMLSLALVSIAQDNQSRPDVFKISVDENVMISGVSDNGLWGVSQISGDQYADNPQPTGGYIIDMTTREMVAIQSPHDYAGVNDISDNRIVAGMEGGLPAYYNPETGAWTHLPVPGVYVEGGLIAITPDARWAVGYAGTPLNVLEAAPVLYDLSDNSLVELPNVPTKGKNGVEYNQCAFFNISPDGRYVLGQVAQSYMMDEGTAPMWTFVYDTTDNTYRAIGFDIDFDTWTFTPQVEGLHFINTQFMSPNGEWVTGMARMCKPVPGSEWPDEYVACYRYHVTDGAFEIYDAETETDFAGSRVLNDGTVLAHTPSQSPYPMAYVRSGDFFIGLDDILSQVYGMRLYECIGDEVTGASQGVSADGLTAVMVTYDNCYVIRMKEPFAEAASRVDLLADYTPSVPVGSSMTKLKSMSITFGRPIASSGDYSAITVVDEDGNTLLTALEGTGVRSDNDRIFNIGLRTYTMQPGKKYTVVIPAGYIHVKGYPSVKAKEIRLTYVGRADGSVQLVSASPASGTKVAQFDSASNPVTLVFDNDILPSDDFSAALYLDGQESPLCALQAYYSGRMLMLVPASTQYLFEGSEYHVTLAAGSVADLSGSGPNEEIVLHYHGAYVRQISADEKYLFSEDMTSYDQSFIFWQTEWNEPGPVAESWGFTKDNPWYPVRDEGAYEQAMAAHSMFITPGTADDWMMTPQLYIPDGNCQLHFQAQSYLKSKEDLLKVYVWPNDKVINSVGFNDVNTVSEAIRAQADLVFAQVLSPGENEEVLAGEWTDYVIDLAPYEGKSVYIAFNNNNTDQSAVIINLVQVVRNFHYLTSLITPESVVGLESVAIEGVLTIEDDAETYSKASLKLYDGEGNLFDAIVEEGLGLKKGDRYNFRFAKELPLALGEINGYSLEISLDERVVKLDQTVKNLAFEPVRKVVLEEYTGRNCGNCPLGLLAIERLEQLYPDNFIPIAVRTYQDDPLGFNVSGYGSFLGMSAAPSGRMNRGAVINPMVSVGEDYMFSGNGLVDSNTGEPIIVWADQMAIEMESPAEGDINFNVEYDAATGHLSAPCTVRYAMNATGKNIGIFAVVLEDDILTRQENYFGQYTDPDLGEWGAGGSLSGNKVTIRIDDVARMTIGSSYNGTMMNRTDFAAGETYTHTVEATIPDGYISDPAKCRLVVMMIDGVNQRVINANVAPFGGSTGVASAVTPAGVKISAADRCVTVKSDADVRVEVYSTTGLLLAAATGRGEVKADLGGYKGVAIVAARTAGGVVTSKVIIR